MSVSKFCVPTFSKKLFKKNQLLVNKTITDFYNNNNIGNHILPNRSRSM